MRFSVRKLALMAVLVAVALIVFIVEAQVPLPVPLPGAKLGLANAVTLFALFLKQGDVKQGAGSSASQTVEKSHTIASKQKERQIVSLRTVDAFMILVCRIILGALFTGRVVAFIYSIVGGLMAFGIQAVMRRFVADKQIWVCGAFGAMFHNIGQICAAMIITGTMAVAAYLPVLIVLGIITGVITGLVAQFTISRVSKAARI